MNATAYKSTNRTEGGFPACLCGCDEMVSQNAYYRPGHDARHAGRVGRQAAQSYFDGQGDWRDPSFYRELPSANLKHKAERIAENAVERGEVKTKPEPKVQVTKQGTEGRVKVGRWYYPARMTRAGKVERNTKRDGSGKWAPADATKFEVS